MQLAKPFEVQPLVDALKAKGLVDAENLLQNDVLGTVFDWLNSSVTLEAALNPLLAVAVPVLELLETKGSAEIQSLLAPKPSA